MENNKFYKGIKNIRTITMTSAEKNAMKRRILGAPIKSPWSVYSFSVWFQHNHWAYGVVAVLIVVLTSGGLVSASQRSLPGDALYAVKTSLVEPTQELLTVTPLAKAELQSSFATERLEEAEQLAAQGKLDSAREKQIKSLLNSHAEAFNLALNNIEKNTGTDSSSENTSIVVENVSDKFKINMKAHAKLLDTISNQDNNEKENGSINRLAEIARINAGLADNSAIAPVTVMSMSVATDMQEDSSAADATSSKRVDIIKGKNQDKKDFILQQIKKTRVDIDSVATDNTPLGQSILDSTKETLDQAEKDLENADWHDNQGNQEKVKDLLRKSKQSAEEADVLFHAGQKLEKSNRGRSRDN